MTQPFTREDVCRARPQILHEGRFGNARVLLFRRNGENWVVKDFGPKPALVRLTLGRYFLRRELAAMRRLQGVPGVPQNAFRVDQNAVAYRHLPGRVLRRIPRDQLSPDYFPALERLVMQMHAKGVAHLDLRYRHNVLVLDDGTPGLIDFQTFVCLDGFPGWLQRHFKQMDLGGVYKHWRKRASATLDPAKSALLNKQNALRRFWILRGYGGLARKWTRLRQARRARAA